MDKKKEEQNGLKRMRKYAQKTVISVKTSQPKARDGYRFPCNSLSLCNFLMVAVKQSGQRPLREPRGGKVL